MNFFILSHISGDIDVAAIWKGLTWRCPIKTENAAVFNRVQTIYPNITLPPCKILFQVLTHMMITTVNLVVNAT